MNTILTISLVLLIITPFLVAIMFEVFTPDGYISKKYGDDFWFKWLDIANKILLFSAIINFGTIVIISIIKILTK